MEGIINKLAEIIKKYKKYKNIKKIFKAEGSLLKVCEGLCIKVTLNALISQRNCPWCFLPGLWCSILHLNLLPSHLLLLWPRWVSKLLRTETLASKEGTRVPCWKYWLSSSRLPLNQGRNGTRAEKKATKLFYHFKVDFFLIQHSVSCCKPFPGFWQIWF